MAAHGQVLAKNKTGSLFLNVPPYVQSKGKKILCDAYPQLQNWALLNSDIIQPPNTDKNQNNTTERAALTNYIASYSIPYLGIIIL